MTVVVLDANALMMPFQFKINLDLELARLLGEHRVVIPEPIIGELEGMKERDRFARMAFRLSDKYEKVGCEKAGDEAVLELAEKLGGMVVTNDKELKARAVKKGLSVISLRQRNHLVMESVTADG